MAAIFLAYKVSCALLGGIAAEETEPTAEESVALARRSGMPGAMVISLNSLAMTLAERDPTGPEPFSARASNSASTPGQEVATGFLTACLVARTARGLELALALAARTMVLWRWVRH